ncbi:MAG: hypothetical protein HY908_08650 [Myxococcales bacterium]|nr:hypothetical protein [Myxococcales bacterium]
MDGQLSRTRWARATVFPRRAALCACAALAPGGLVACQPAQAALAIAEATDALVEATGATQALVLTARAIELGTSFAAVDDPETSAAAHGARLLVDLPCALVAVDGATVSVEHGAECAVMGRALAGSQLITIVANDDEGIVVDHEWTGLTDGIVSVDGWAEAVWLDGDEGRTVLHEISWTRLADERTGVGYTELYQSPAAGGLAEGVLLEGLAFWTGLRGEWGLELYGADVRWVDAVPQAGLYVLDTPYSKSVHLSFQRLDPVSISVTVAGPVRSYDFAVDPSGELF